MVPPFAQATACLRFASRKWVVEYEGSTHGGGVPMEGKYPWRGSTHGGEVPMEGEYAWSRGAESMCCANGGCPQLDLA